MITLHSCPNCHKILTREDRFGKRRGVLLPIGGSKIKIGSVVSNVKCTRCGTIIPITGGRVSIIQGE